MFSLLNLSLRKRMPSYQHNKHRNGHNCEICRAQKPKSVFRIHGVLHRFCIACWKDKRPKVRRWVSRFAHRSYIRRWADSIVIQAILRKVRKGVITTAQAEEKATKMLKLPDRIAAILGKTFVVRGDDFTLEDDVALMRIRDLIDEIDPKAIQRNKNKRLFSR